MAFKTPDPVRSSEESDKKWAFGLCGCRSLYLGVPSGFGGIHRHRQGQDCLARKKVCIGDLDELGMAPVVSKDRERFVS